MLRLYLRDERRCLVKNGRPVTHIGPQSDLAKLAQVMTEHRRYLDERGIESWVQLKIHKSSPGGIGLRRSLRLLLARPLLPHPHRTRSPIGKR
jgi:hypothetical protein